jgi:S-adenosylmethionine decarboxylase proenzyme
MDALGKHVIAELYECDRDIINNQKLIESYMVEAVKISGATLVKSIFHKFSPHGITGVVVVAESHFSIHTWPEYGYCAIDIFTCGEITNNRLAVEYLKNKLHAENISIVELKRGLLNSNQTDNDASQIELNKENIELNKRFKLRFLLPEDYQYIKELMSMVFSDIYSDDPAWSIETFQNLISNFPDGQFCIEDNGKVVAAALSIIITYSKYGDNHTYHQIIGSDEDLSTHEPSGDTLYGIDVFVHPDYRGLRLGSRLYDARRQLCKNLNLRSIIFGGRLPGYKEYMDKMTIQEYVACVKKKELSDLVLSFQLSNEFQIRCILKNYIPEDVNSGSYAALLEWNNIYYEFAERSNL